MPNSTSFKKGNQWRFSENCQPIRKMTPKQTLKALDNLISMSADELQEFLSNLEAPQFLRVAAQKIADGEIDYVVALRIQYTHSL